MQCFFRTPGDGTTGCYGTDLNRNYGFHFNDGGSSDFECSDTYHGKSAFSEPENQNVRDFLLKNKDHVKYYQSLHSYSQLVLTPWGYTMDPPANYDKLLSLANEVICHQCYSKYIRQFIESLNQKIWKR